VVGVSEADGVGVGVGDAVGVSDALGVDAFTVGVLNPAADAAAGCLCSTTIAPALPPATTTIATAATIHQSLRRPLRCPCLDGDGGDCDGAGAAGGASNTEVAASNGEAAGSNAAVHESGDLAGGRSAPNQGSAVVIAASTADPPAAVGASQGAVCSWGAAAQEGGADHSGVAVFGGGGNGIDAEVCAAVADAGANGSWAAPNGVPQT